MNILIAEDNMSFALYLEMLLKSTLKNPKIEKMLDSPGNWEVIKAHSWQLFLVDIRIQNSDGGLIFCDYAKKKNIPFVVITSYKDKNKITEILKHSPNFIFTKPLDEVAFKYWVTNLFNSVNLFQYENNRQTGTHVSENYTFIKKNSELIKINYTNLICLQADGNYVHLHTTQGKYIKRTSLSKELEILPSDYFVQVHRNYVANLQLIQSFSLNKQMVRFEKLTIPLGRAFKKNLLKTLHLKHDN